MQDTDNEEPTKVEEVLEVVKAAKLMTEVVITAQPTTTAAQVPKPSAPRRRRGVIIQDPEETATSVIMHLEVQSKDKGKGIFIKEPKPLKVQAQIDMDEEFDIAKKQRIDEEAEELKTHLQIVDNDDDDVYTEATPLASKIVKQRFESTEPKNFSEYFLLNTFKIMFEKPNVEASVWRDQKGIYSLAKVKS
nr:hypothetical protein [Tanacetum cinerariifolium]